MCLGWSRLELRVSLGSDVVRVDFTRELNILHQVPIWAGAGKHQAAFGDLVAVSVVHLVAMTVALVRDLGAINFSNDAAWCELCLVASKSHGSTKVSPSQNINLLCHGRNHWISCLWLKF